MNLLAQRDRQSDPQLKSVYPMLCTPCIWEPNLGIYNHIGSKRQEFGIHSYAPFVYKLGHLAFTQEKAEHYRYGVQGIDPCQRVGCYRCGEWRLSQDHFPNKGYRRGPKLGIAIRHCERAKLTPRIVESRYLSREPGGGIWPMPQVPLV